MGIDKTIYKIAKAYYEKGLTQQQIANRYGLSRIKVSRLINRALKDKLVQIKIVSPDDPYSDIEHKLEEKYGFDEIIIIEKDNTDNWIEKAGLSAAEYLINQLSGNETIGLTWGRSLLSLVNNLTLQHFPDIKVVQMLGGLGEPEAEYHGADLTRRMAQAFGSKPRLIQSPGIMKTEALCNELKEDIQVRDTLSLAARADIAVVGIGLFADNSQITKNPAILSEKDKADLKNAGVIGDISLRFFNQDGKYVQTSLDERIVGISTTELTSIPRIIGIAGSEEKYDVIQAVARGKLVHVLITDNITANKLLTD